MDLEEFVHYLQSLPEYRGQIVHLERIPARPARYGELSAPLPKALEQALNEKGIQRLYSHQAEAIDAVRRGEHVIIATGTASGKSLCYHLPVLEAHLQDPLARALYLFPTKALAQDQLRALKELSSGKAFRLLRFGTYDGDTPQNIRGRLRKAASIILSNPDMLHVGILPNHTSWASFFRHLRYVVLDEAHIYRGVFGSHTACLLRRLQRVCQYYGSSPQFILCSATIANPAAHAQRLISRPVTVIDNDGAPRGPRLFLLWNPPYLDRALGLRRSTNTEATWLFTQMVKKGIRNITFVRARRVAELILLYAQNALRREQPELAERISAYRGGYLAEERREIERRLFTGELLGVTATNALELGIDVGHLDATILVGYPGTIASTWQQAGRAGRGKRKALSILIGQDNPLDQFFMQHPEELFGRSHEEALIDPQNPYIQREHLACAAFERPLEEKDLQLFENAAENIAALEKEGILGQRQGRWYFIPQEYPAQRVSLRATTADNYLLIEETSGQILEEVEAATAFIRIHPGAIYLHRGESYLITQLDIGRRLALAQAVTVNYYTQPRELNDVHIIRSLQVRHLPSTNLFFGQVRVRQQVISFVRKQQFTDAVLSEEPLDLPPYSFETQALWFEVPPPIQREIARQGLDFAGGIHAVEHACIGILPLFAMCDRNDIGGLSAVIHPDTGQAQIFIYDAYPGGVGIAQKGFEIIKELWQRTLETIRQCPCEAGCPSCIQSPKCGNNNEPLDKAASIRILELLLDPARGS